MPGTADIEPLHRGTGGFRPVRLSSTLKAEFDKRDGEHRRTQAVSGMVLGLSCYLGLLGIDWLVVPDVAVLNATLRIGVGLPIGAAATWLLMRPGLPSLVYEALPAIFGLTCAMTIAVVMSRSAEPAALAYFCAGLVVMCFTINLVGMNPPVAALTCLAIAITMALFSAASPLGSIGVLVTNLVFGLMVGAVATFANWCLLNQRRHAFLMRRRDEHRLEQIARQRDLLQRLASIDTLTDLPNRRGFDAMVAGDLAAITGHTSLAAMMIDVDCFKAFNDGYGHPQGDEALRIVANALNEACGDRDRIGRLGGEEFGIVLFGRDPDEMLDIGRRLCRAVEACAIPHGWSEVAPVVTISVGIAAGWTSDGRGDCSHLFSIADKALYDAKRSGRNRAIMADGSAGSVQEAANAA